MRISLPVRLAAAALLCMPCTVPAAPFTFSTGPVNGLMGMASRPGPGSGPNQETEAADDFITPGLTSITSATFTGLVPLGATVSQVLVEVYRVFPQDSDTTRSIGVPTRVNSPSDAAFDARDSSVAGELSFATVGLGDFTVLNSVDGGIHASPNQTTGGEGSRSGEEILFDVSFLAPLLLPANHYFFVPQVLLGDPNQHFLWLSGQRPLTGAFGETPFSPDLQAWMRNADLDPDWLRVGTDIVGGSPAPTFNGAFTLTGEVRAVTVPEPSSGALAWLALVLTALTLRAGRRVQRP